MRSEIDLRGVVQCHGQGSVIGTMQIAPHSGSAAMPLLGKQHVIQPHTNPTLLIDTGRFGEPRVSVGALRLGFRILELGFGQQLLEGLSFQRGRPGRWERLRRPPRLALRDVGIISCDVGIREYNNVFNYLLDTQTMSSERLVKATPVLLASRISLGGGGVTRNDCAIRVYERQYPTLVLRLLMFRATCNALYA